MRIYAREWLAKQGVCRSCAETPFFDVAAEAEKVYQYIVSLPQGIEQQELVRYLRQLGYDHAEIHLMMGLLHRHQQIVILMESTER